MTHYAGLRAMHLFASAHSLRRVRASVAGCPLAGWAGLPLALVADNTWEASVNFDGQARQRFKSRPKTVPPKKSPACGAGGAFG
ncbi:hypothetical protein [Janthinobacterium sp.]|uniref:hypothetical protein n=1 Tax=Janthinobacterium sp. TaxID=1871054 RepID=UPI00293D618E|nr:hypothetical protein [Janthinobacterium sp.]